jgi:hypothetical protein
MRQMSGTNLATNDIAGRVAAGRRPQGAFVIQSEPFVLVLPAFFLAPFLCMGPMVLFGRLVLRLGFCIPARACP